MTSTRPRTTARRWAPLPRASTRSRRVSRRSRRTRALRFRPKWHDGRSPASTTQACAQPGATSSGPRARWHAAHALHGAIGHAPPVKSSGRGSSAPPRSAPRWACWRFRCSSFRSPVWCRSETCRTNFRPRRSARIIGMPEWAYEPSRRGEVEWLRRGLHDGACYGWRTQNLFRCRSESRKRPAVFDQNQACSSSLKGKPINPHAALELRAFPLSVKTLSTMTPARSTNKRLIRLRYLPWARGQASRDV